MNAEDPTGLNPAITDNAWQFVGPVGAGGALLVDDLYAQEVCLEAGEVPQTRITSTVGDAGFPVCEVSAVSRVIDIGVRLVLLGVGVELMRGGSPHDGESPAPSSATETRDGEPPNGGSPKSKGGSCDPAPSGAHILLGLESYGLRELAVKIGATTLMNSQSLKHDFACAMQDPTTRFSVNTDGMWGGTDIKSKILTAVARYQGGSPGYTDWEMTQLYNTGRLTDVTFYERGAVVANPFA
jgi:hypothetical protein